MGEGAAMKAKTGICLCMMVRNESMVIRRAIESAIPFMDSWAITDTGSEDDTMFVVADALAEIPGKLYRAPWVDFATGRTKAFLNARSSGAAYVLMMDADQTLVVEDPHALTHLTADVYNIDIRHSGLVYPHPWLLSTRFDWHWEGATHEWLADAGRIYGPCITGAYLREHADSNRRRSGRKATEDRAYLEAAYAEDPTDARTVFYLGQTCQDEGKLSCAVEWYLRRVKMGGWLEEAWCAQYRIGNCHDLGMHWSAAVNDYLAAHQMFPSRAEPLFRLGNGFFMRHHFELARMFFDEAAQIDKPVSGLFVESAIYDYAALQGFAWSCRALNRVQEAEEAEAILVGNPGTPDHVVKAIWNAIETRTFGRII